LRGTARQTENPARRLLRHRELPARMNLSLTKLFRRQAMGFKVVRLS